MKLRISDNLVLAADFVTSTQAILAQKGKGKSFTAAVEAEELLDAGQVVVIIDPTDAHFGLRSSPDGRAKGYPIVVFGGDHGDVQLEPGGGAVLAEAIVRERFSAIICTETMTKGEELRFVGDFLETLYRKNREAMHLFIDESDIFAPQQTFGVADARTCGATDDIVRRGRKKGIGCTLITQRASAINKNVLSQADMLVAMGCSHPLDLDAIEKWVRKNADPALAKEMMASLPSLPRGVAWAWNPSQHLFKKIAIRQRRTFDSGATPKAGEKKREPKVLAPVDLARLGQAMAETVQRQKDNDPTELKKQVAALRKELANQKDRQAENTALRVEVVAIRKELANVGKGQDRAEANEKELHGENVGLRAEIARLKEQLAKRKKPVLAAGDVARLEKVVSRAEAALSKQDAAVSRHHEVYQTAIEGYTRSSKAIISATMVAIDGLRASLFFANTPPQPASPPPPPVVRVPANTFERARRKESAPAGLTPAHLRFLSAIAWWEGIGVSTPDLGGVAFIARTSTKSSAFDNTRSRLHAGGYITYPTKGRVQLTEAGRAIAPPPTAPPTNAALHKAILEEVTPAHGRMLRVLIEEYPTELSLEEFAKRAGTSISSSAFDNNRSWLRARGLAEYPRTGFVRATKLLFPEAS